VERQLTTIAVRDGIVAFDSMISCDDFIAAESSNKAIISLKHGCVFAGAGSMAAIGMGFNRLEMADKLPWQSRDYDPRTIGDTDMLVIFPNGDIWCLAEAGYYKCIAPFVATGSGFMLATVAMDMGANAVEAIEMACKWGRSTGGPVRHIALAKVNWGKPFKSRRKKP
jgi:hypothetical protein